MGIRPLSELWQLKTSERVESALLTPLAEFIKELVILILGGVDPIYNTIIFH